MTRFLHALALAALILLSLDARFAGVRADDAADCDEGSGDTKIRGCSRIIKSGRLFGKPISKEDLATAYSNRGNAYRKKGPLDRAVADYDKAIKLNPKLVKAYYSRGNAYFNKGQYDRAIVDFDTTIKLNPKYARAYHNRGIAYEKLGQRDKAIADFRKAFELDPSNEKRKEPLKRLGVTP